jgi:antitoxin (DNA-binding transcriptional repressor) of toxin-antitoxin stability system
MRIAIADFKARCLGLLDEIHSHGGRIVVTKRGREIALVEPAGRPETGSDPLAGARLRPDWR